MPDADWSASGASFAKPTAQQRIYALEMEELRKPGSSVSSTACPVSHLRLVNPAAAKCSEEKPFRFYSFFDVLNHTSALSAPQRDEDPAASSRGHSSKA